jgi:hypothetical protein
VNAAEGEAGGGSTTGNVRAAASLNQSYEVRADQLRAEDLGATIKFPVGLDQKTIYLTEIRFYRYERSIRVVVVGLPTEGMYDRPAHSSVKFVLTDTP